MLTKADALSKFIWVAVCSIALLAFRTPAPGIIMTAALLLLLLTDRKVSLVKLVRGLPLVLLVPTCLLLFHSVSHEGREVLRLGFLSVTREGLNEGLILFFRVAFVVLASLTFLWTSDIRELMVGLVRVRVPYSFAFAIYIALRYIPTMRVERNTIREAFAVRCQSQLIRMRWRFRLWMRYIFLLVINGLQKAEQTAVAMQIRGFGMRRRRTFITPFRFTFHGAALLSGSLLVIGTLLWRFG